MISTHYRILLIFLILGLICIVHASASDTGNDYESSSSQWCDHFLDGTLDPGWTWIREDPDHWSLSEKPGYLRIIIQHGDLYGSWNHNENSLIRPAPAGDFELLTRLTITPTVNYQQAGLVIYQDDDHYIRLTRAFADKNIVQMLREDGAGIIAQEVDCNLDTVYLLIRKQGTTFSGYWSADGNNWIEVNQYSDLPLTNLNIGLVAFVSPANTEIPVDFDFVCIIPTDGVGTQAVADSVSPVPTRTQSEFPVIDDSDFDQWPTISSDQNKVSDTSSSCTIDANGNVFLAIYAEGTVVVIHPDGEETVYVSGIDRPRFPVLDSAGNLYVGSYDGTIQQFAPDGTRTILASGIWSPQGMALDAEDTLYVAGGYDGKIYRITKSGKITSIDSNLKTPRSLAVTKEGGIYYADTNGKEILFITPEGNYAGLADVGKNITGLALDNDTLYVSFEDTIAKVNPDGNLIPVIQNLDKPNLYTVQDGIIGFTQQDGSYLLPIREISEIPSPSPTPEVTPTRTPSPEVKPSSGYIEATINHSGFDFSLGETGEYPTYDGEVIAWQPGGITHPDYPRDSDYLWWRNEHLDQITYSTQTKDMGAVDIASVRTVPSQWDTTPLIPPLLKGHTIVAKCDDGYVKFQIISIDPADWSARVRYWYSPGKTFDDTAG